MKHAAADRDALFLCMFLQQAIALSSVRTPGRLLSVKINSGCIWGRRLPSFDLSSLGYGKMLPLGLRNVLSLQWFGHSPLHALGTILSVFWRMCSSQNRRALPAHPRCWADTRSCTARPSLRVLANALRCFWEEINWPGEGAPGFFYQFFSGRGPLETVPLANRQPFLEKRQCSRRLR